jgi:hypothetical protein
LPKALAREAAAQQISPSDTKALLHSLPSPIATAPVIRDAEGTLRYDFGETIAIRGTDQRLDGIERYPEVAVLLRALQLLNRHLSQEDFQNYLARLVDPFKHLETLFEARPLFRLTDCPASFEVPGLGSGDKRIDWFITPPHMQPVLLEVKYRTADIIEHLRPHLSALDRADETIKFEPGDPARLFPSVVEKFIAASPDVRLQGAWIHTNVRILKSMLLEHMKSLPPEHVHFVVLSGWRASAHVVSNVSGVVAKLVQRAENSLTREG